MVRNLVQSKVKYVSTSKSNLSTKKTKRKFSKASPATGNQKSGSKFTLSSHRSASSSLDEKSTEFEKTKAMYEKWENLPKGREPQYFEKTNHKQEDLLIIDSIGFEDLFNKWLRTTGAINLQTLLENLQNPSTFTRFTKSSVDSVEIQIDQIKPEIIITSKKKEIRIPFMQVTEIRFGPKTKRFEIWRNQIQADNLTFTIIYGREKKQINLMAKYVHKIQLWLSGLVILIPFYKGDSSEFTYITEFWYKLGKKILNLSEIIQLLENMKIKATKIQLFNILKERAEIIMEENSIDDITLTLEDFFYLIQVLRIPKEVIEIFNSLSNKNNIITPPILLEFLQNIQNEKSYSLDDVIEIFNMFCENQQENQLNESLTLNLHCFANFLSSEYGEIFNPFMFNIYQNMDLPLSDYFIYSSHNTYLEGNQISGFSSCDMYARVLKAGCRCVELDCWNGDNGEPIIFHGHTLTTRILFEDAVRAIRDYAFVSSEFPVILSLENHCNIEQQTKMAEIMKRYFGDLIAMPIQDQNMEYLPSPNQLKRKILIKGKVEK